MSAPASTPYNWRNVAIGGGGFVTGVVFSPVQSNPAYARTDVGGFYRWDGAANRWTLLNDPSPMAQGDLFGGESIALDPVDPTSYAAAGKYQEDVVRLLLDRGAEVDQTDGNEFRTALMAAANNGHLAVVGLLLDHGADPNAADDYDETVLARAASVGHLDVVRMLLRAGAQPSTPGELGKPPHELAQEEGHPEVAAELLRALGAETGST